MAQRFGVTSSTVVRAATPTPGTAPVTGRCTSYGTLHPIRTGALPTYRVHCLRIGCSAHTRATAASVRQPAAYAPPLSPHSPIPHAIPRRPDALTPQKPQDFNVLTSKVEVCARELHAKFGSESRIETAEPRQHQRMPAQKLRRSAALEVGLRRGQDLFPHADRILVRLAGLGLVVGDRR